MAQADGDGSGSLVPLNGANLALLVGRRIEIEYQDKTGAATRREVTIKGATNIYGRFAIRGLCHLRNEERTFLVQRIRRCWFPGWQELYRAHRAKQRAEAIERLSAMRVVMRWLVAALLLSLGGCVFSRVNMTPASVPVSGYTRSDGRTVSAYNRRPPGARKADAPYEMLALLSAIVMLGSGVLLWFKSGESKRLSEDIKALGES